MRAVVQRVRRASVSVEQEIVGAIGKGLLVYLGAGKGDDARDVDRMVRKLSGLRIFPDDAGKMSRSVRDVGGEVLVVSQFTLYGDVRAGLRPSFVDACPPERAEELYQSVVAGLRREGLSVATGRFRANMDVVSTVWGPVTVLIDSRKTF